MNDALKTDALGVVERVVEGVLDPADEWQVRAAVLAVSPAIIDDVVFGCRAAELGAAADGVLLGVGSPASPGVGIGVAVHSTEAALDLYELGVEIVLVCDETGPMDEPAMRVASAIVTRSGGLASHAAIMARSWGIPAVCGIGDLHIDTDSTLLVDGATGEVRLLDDQTSISSEGPLSELPAAVATLLEWADSIASPRLAVMANADVAADALVARSLGAQGIGLCRTEHQFLGGRAELMARVLSGDSDAVDELAAVQRTEFVDLLEAMPGVPITIRLLDAPLHEFLGRRAAGDEEPPPAVGGVHREHNPMLGLRGVRLSLMYPQILEAQITALCNAMADLDDPLHPRPVRVMVPMVSLAGELSLTRARIEEMLERVATTRRRQLRLSIGAMIETPQAALIAGPLASSSDFFAFGTNDLTQLTWGFSRDDVDTALVPLYRSLGLLERNPFESLDVTGVVRLMALAAETGRAVNPTLGLSVCGEQGADPASVAVAVQLGLDSVSVSPYRVPAARLAAAHAVLAVSGLG